MYQVDPKTRDIIINGFEKGIGDDPHSGLTDMRSMNPTSVPGEAAVNFKTQSVFLAPVYTNIVATESGVSNLFTVGSSATLLLENNQAILITASTVSGVSSGTLIWVDAVSQGAGNTQFSLTSQYSDYRISPGTGPSTGTSGTITFSTIQPAGVPKYFTQAAQSNWMIDANGYVWSDFYTTGGYGGVGATNSWTWTGNSVLTGASGNGLAYLATPGSGSGDGWIFGFRGGTIDYIHIENNGNISHPVWVYGWDPNNGSSGNTTNIQNIIYHQALSGPDGALYFLNSNSTTGKKGDIGKVSINSGSVSYTAFNPASGPSSTNYSYADFNLIPAFDTPISIAPFGTGYLIGGIKNFAYNWDSTSSVVSDYIYVAESFIYDIITVNTNGYLFVGNRGNIYVTNGSQADIWAKVPDHISGTIEPNFVFLRGAYWKGELYFGVQVSSQAGTVITGYGGVWAVNITTKAKRIAQELSYASYGGYASCVLGGFVTSNLPSGTGIYIGWTDGSGGYGVDQSLATPYSQTNQSWVTSDIIPVGTAINPTTSAQVEFKLARPLVSGESVKIDIGSYLDMTYGSFVTAGTLSYSSSATANNLSAIYPIHVEKQQWCLVRAMSISTGTTPSFVRLTEMRIKGAIQ